jgi:transposase-like protein
MPRRCRAFWVKLVKEVERTGARHWEIAERHGVGVGTLRSWIYRLRRERPATESVPLLPVRVIASTAPTAREAGDDAARIEVELLSGLRLRFPTGTDGAYVASLVRHLG